MRWLITVKQGSSIDSLARKVASCGGCCDLDVEPVPLGEQEQVLEADGPDDLPQRLADDPMVVHVHPSSEMGLH